MFMDRLLQVQAKSPAADDHGLCGEATLRVDPDCSLAEMVAMHERVFGSRESRTGESYGMQSTLLRCTRAADSTRLDSTRLDSTQLNARALAYSLLVQTDAWSS